jgi:hypothetical protein
MPPDEFARFVVQETERWRDVIRRANIRPEYGGMLVFLHRAPDTSGRDRLERGYCDPEV